MINQDATLERLQLAAGDNDILSVGTGRTGMLHIVSGAIDTATTSLSAGDAVIIDDGSKLQLAVTADAEALWFNLP